jgi:mRNA interferase YafQ
MTLEFDMLAPIRSGQFKRVVRRPRSAARKWTGSRPSLLLLIGTKALPALYNDHPPTGDWRGPRDLHIDPDWLLLYRVEDNELQLARTGTHADLFDE